MRRYVRARSGLRKRVPTSRGVPSGSRKSSAEDGTSSNHGTLDWVWSKNVWSTSKPRMATPIAGHIASRSEIVP